MSERFLDPTPADQQTIEALRELGAAKISVTEREKIKALWCGEVARAIPDWLAPEFAKALRARLDQKPRER